MKNWKLTKQNIHKCGDCINVKPKPLGNDTTIYLNDNI